jgi:hypothetical protein
VAAGQEDGVDEDGFGLVTMAPEAGGFLAAVPEESGDLTATASVAPARAAPAVADSALQLAALIEDPMPKTWTT